MERTRARRGAVFAAVVAVLLVAAGTVWWLWPRATTEASKPPPPVVTPTEAPARAARRGPCVRPPAHPFVPASIQVVGRSQAVRPVARTADGVMGVLPDSDKADFATDEDGVKAGARRGRVLLNTHTWPDGTAMGNRLLARLHVGDRIVLRGHGQTACYRITSREEVLASDGYPGWDRSTGRHQVVIVVCSGTRLGPGNWTDRTLWFADPYLGGRPPA